MARPAGLEPAAPGLEGRCSLQLSYGRNTAIVARGRRHPTPCAAQAPPRWLAQIDEHLAHFQSLGISVVRRCIFADGLTRMTPRFPASSGNSPLPRPTAGSNATWRGSRGKRDAVSSAPDGRVA